LQTLLKQALAQTAQLWPALQTAYEWVHQITDILANPHQLKGAEVRQQLEDLLSTMQRQQDKVAVLGNVVEHFAKVTANYAPGLFYTYDRLDLPRTNNDLEQCFGSVRRHERRATGRKGAVPGLIVRGPVRVLAAIATKRQCFLVQGLKLRDPLAWHNLRSQLASRQDTRIMQLHFCKDPSAYLAALERMLIKASLPT
jgi:hypothetical protein